jgi:hypothetical protein
MLLGDDDYSFVMNHQSQWREGDTHWRCLLHTAYVLVFGWQEGNSYAVWDGHIAADVSFYWCFVEVARSIVSNKLHTAHSTYSIEDTDRVARTQSSDART